MRNVPGICVTESTDSIIRFGEKRSVIRFHNNNRLLFKKVQVDGCAITDGIKCDYLLCSENEQDEYFIELKGSDISHAIDQLRATILQLGEYNNNRHAFVVCTNVAPILSTEIQRAKSEFKQRFNSDLLIKKTPFELSL